MSSDADSGRVTLVLLPGLDGTGRLFAPFVAALGSEVETRVLRYPTDAPLDYSALEELVRAVLPSTGRYVILGESFSGPVAVAIAATADPRRLAGLVLASTFVRSPRPFLGRARCLLPILPVTAMPDAVLAWFVLGHRASADRRAALAAAAREVRPAVIRARLAAVLTCDVTAHFAAVRVPVLSLRATRDWVIPVAATRLITRLRPDASTVAIDGPHGLLQARPAEAARAVLAFVSRVSRPLP